jgi:uridine monophosphate synthetase
MSEDSSGCFAKLTNAVAHNHSRLCVHLSPNPLQLPAHLRGEPGNLLTDLLFWQKRVIQATRDLACAYLLEYSWFHANGVAGLTLLQEVIVAIPTRLPIILETQSGATGPAATALAHHWLVELGMDAVAILPYAGRDAVTPFASVAGKGVFVTCQTANPSASEVQALEINDWRTLDREPNQPLSVHIARMANTWATPIGLLLETTDAATVAAVRQAAPLAWLLLAAPPTVPATVSGQTSSSHAALLPNLLVDDQVILTDGGSIAQAIDVRRAAEAYLK